MDTTTLLKTYLQYRGLEEGSKALQSSYFPSIDENLSRQDRALSIMQKQRELGLPVSSDVYDRSTRKEDTFFDHAVRQTSRRGLKALEPKRTPFQTKPEPLFDVAKNLTSELFSLGKSIPKRGGRYATIFGTVRGAFS